MPSFFTTLELGRCVEGRGVEYGVGFAVGFNVVGNDVGGFVFISCPMVFARTFGIVAAVVVTSGRVGVVVVTGTSAAITGGAGLSVRQFLFQLM